MMNDVSSFLGKQDLLGKLVVVSDDSKANGSFLIHHFISQALKDGHVVYLVSFAQSFIHYSTIAAKLGVNLSRFQTTAQFVYVDCLSRLLDGMWAEPGGTEATPPINTSGSTITYTLDGDGTLRGLYSILQSSLSCRTTQKPVCLVLDDLSVLISVGVRTRNVESFVRYCRELTSGLDTSTAAGYVVAMVHREGEEEEGRLRSWLISNAHLSLSVNGLKTGYSREIHGEVKAECKEPYPQPSHCPSTKLAQFKLSDKTVRLFAKGTSTAVL